MATRLHRKLAMLHKIEVTPGVDVTPATADAIIASNVSITPIEAEEVSRDLMLPYMGNPGVVLAGIYGRIEFDVEIAGAGDAGDSPKYASLLRICGLAETLTAGTKADYTIVEDAVETGTLYFVQDRVRHVLLGCQGNVSLSIAPKAIPKFRFTLIGMLGTISDLGAMPAATLAGWVTPVTVSKANTTMSLHGWNAVAESLSLDLGNTLTPRFLIGDERCFISDRKPTGSAVLEAKLLAETNWFQRALDRTRGALSLVHGTAAGNIVEITAPAVEIGKPTQGQTDGIVNYTVPLSLIPVAGRDELKITVR